MNRFKNLFPFVVSISLSCSLFAQKTDGINPNQVVYGGAISLVKVGEDYVLMKADDDPSDPGSRHKIKCVCLCWGDSDYFIGDIEEIDLPLKEDCSALNKIFCRQKDGDFGITIGCQKGAVPVGGFDLSNVITQNELNLAVKAKEEKGKPTIDFYLPELNKKLSEVKEDELKKYRQINTKF